MNFRIRDPRGAGRGRTAGLLVLIGFLSMAGPAFGGRFEEAVSAYERDDYAMAFRLMKPLAERGDARAQHNLGVMYDHGRGVPQDSARAMTWYRKAADRGIPEAQHNLGFMYEKGQGVPPNPAEAAKWYRRAAEQGMSDSQVNLGMLYYNGQGVPKDYVRAYMWLHLASSRYPESVTDRIKETINYKDLVHSRMTPAQIAEAERLVREWKPKRETK